MAGAKRRSWHDEIILYLGRQFDVPYRDPIRVGAWSFTEVAAHLDAADDFLEDVWAKHDAEMMKDGSLGKPTAFVTWDAGAFLGRTPTEAESSAISRALKTLARGPDALIQSRPRQGEKRRRRVRLTARGKARYRELMASRP